METCQLSVSTPDGNCGFMNKAASQHTLLHAHVHTMVDTLDKYLSDRGNAVSWKAKAHSSPSWHAFV